MDSLPHWEELSDAARTRLLLSIIMMLSTNTWELPNIGEKSAWHELISAGVVANSPEKDALYLTGPGTSLVLDVLEANFTSVALVAA